MMGIRQLCQTLWERATACLRKKSRKVRQEIKPKTVAIAGLAVGVSYLLGPWKFACHFANFVSSRGKYLFAMFFINGCMANTSCDAKFSAFWQRRVRTFKGLDKILRIAKRFGEFGIHFTALLIMLFLINENKNDREVTDHDGNQNNNCYAQIIFNLASCTLIQSKSMWKTNVMS